MINLLFDSCCSENKIPIPEETISNLNRIFGSTSTQLGSSECGTADDIPKDLRIVSGEILGSTLADPIAIVKGSPQGIPGFFHGLDISNGDIFYRVCCGIYMSTYSGQDGIRKNYLDTLDAIVKSGK